jgi:hypothetical protein
LITAENPWRVEESSCGSDLFYRVYRLIDPENPDQYGNRDYGGDLVRDRGEAVVGALILNAMEAQV